MIGADFHLQSSAPADSAGLSRECLLIARPVMPASRTDRRVVAAPGATPYVFPPPSSGRPLTSLRWPTLDDLPRCYAAIFVSPVPPDDAGAAGFSAAKVPRPARLRPVPFSCRELTAQGR